MPDLLVLCPTRGRPAAAREANQSFEATRRLPGTEILFLVDDDDPECEAYGRESYPIKVLPKPGSMVNALNLAALPAAERSGAKFIGFIGDDHRFRTPGWDTEFTNDLTVGGAAMVYGNDTIWLEGQIPTQIFMSSKIISALGWMGLPTCTHLYIDNVWRVIGEHLGVLTYRKDVVVEHIHPAAGRADWDEGHMRVNTHAMYEHDALAFHDWLRTTAEADVERVRSALAS